MSERSDILTVLRGALPELERRYPIRSLSLFGSVVRDEANATSDLDILVEFAGPVSLSAFLALENELGVLTGRRVDLVSRRALKSHIGRRVLSEALLL